MQFKEGLGWKACYDEEKNLYTAKDWDRGDFYLFEIDKEIFDKLDDPPQGEFPCEMIHKGRVLYESHDSAYGSPYDIVHDENYAQMCPWVKIQHSGHEWSREMTEAADEIFGVNKKEESESK